MGQFGYAGETGISYIAMSQYCRDHQVHGDDFRRFMTFLNAVDAEYQAVQAEDRKQRDEAENGRTPKDR